MVTIPSSIQNHFRDVNVPFNTSITTYIPCQQRKHNLKIKIEMSLFTWNTWTVVLSAREVLWHKGTCEYSNKKRLCSRQVKEDIDRAVITTVKWFRRHEFNLPAVPFTFSAFNIADISEDTGELSSPAQNGNTSWTISKGKQELWWHWASLGFFSRVSLP